LVAPDVDQDRLKPTSVRLELEIDVSPNGIPVTPALSADVPLSFVAVAYAVYSVPLVRPVIDKGEDVPEDPVPPPPFVETE
jgi:hypothetical protein